LLYVYWKTIAKKLKAQPLEIKIQKETQNGTLKKREYKNKSPRTSTISESRTYLGTRDGGKLERMKKPRQGEEEVAQPEKSMEKPGRGRLQCGTSQNNAGSALIRKTRIGKIEKKRIEPSGRTLP